MPRDWSFLSSAASTLSSGRADLPHSAEEPTREPQDGLIRHGRPEERHDAEQPRLHCGELFLVEGEQPTQLVVERRARGEAPSAEGVIEEAERMVAIGVGQGFGEDAEAERMPVQPVADLLALGHRTADVHLAEQSGALVGQQPRQLELVKGRAQEALEIGEDEAAGEHGQALVLLLAKRTQQLAQVAIEKAAVARLLRPLLQDLEPVQHDHERMSPNHLDRGAHQVRPFSRLRCAEPLVSPEQELEQEVGRLAILVEAPAEQSGERPALPADCVLEPVAHQTRSCPCPPRRKPPWLAGSRSRTQRSSRASSSSRPVNLSSLVVSWTHLVGIETGANGHAGRLGRVAGVVNARSQAVARPSSRT